MSKVICLILVLLSFVGVFAQEKTIDESEFTAIYNKAKEEREKRSYRMKTVFRNSIEGKPEKANTGTAIIEFAPPSMTRVVLQTNSKTEMTQKERVRVKDKIYTREGKAAWKQEISDNRQTENQNVKTESKAEYKFLGNQTLDNRNVTVYQKIESRKRTREKDNKEITSDIDTKYWFNTNGELLKIERKTTLHVGDEILHNSFVRTYEFDPSIKIETPQIAGTGNK